MKQNKIKYIILIIIGVCLFVGGLVLIISGLSGESVAMGDPGWFDSETTKQGKIFGGIALMVFGVFCGAITIALKNASKIGKGLTKFGKMLEQKNIKSQQFCEYCGSELEANTTCCPSCGARKRKQTKTEDKLFE